LKDAVALLQVARGIEMARSRKIDIDAFLKVPNAMMDRA
jgi:hypothetical protein